MVAGTASSHQNGLMSAVPSAAAAHPLKFILGKNQFLRKGWTNSNVATLCLPPSSLPSLSASLSAMPAIQPATPLQYYYTRVVAAIPIRDREEEEEGKGQKGGSTRSREAEGGTDGWRTEMQYVVHRSRKQPHTTAPYLLLGIVYGCRRVALAGNKSKKTGTGLLLYGAAFYSCEPRIASLMEDGMTLKGTCDDEAFCRFRALTHHH